MNIAQSLASNALVGASAASQPLNSPLSYFLAIEAFSHLQILSLVFYPAFLISSEPANPLAQSLDDVINYIKRPRVLDPFASSFTFYLILCISAGYILSYLCFTIYVITRKYQKLWMNKLLSYNSYLHSRIIFYFLHYFFVRTIDFQKSCKGLSYNTGFCSEKALTTVCVILLSANLILALAKELFCFQIHPSKSPIAVKENLYNLLILLQKTMGFFLFYLLLKPAKTMVILNIFFTVFSLTILHNRLTYYNLKILTVTLILQTSACLLSFCLLPLLWDGNSSNILIIFLAACPLAAKLSLIKLRIDFRNIIFLKSTNPYKIAHLPILLKEARSKLNLFPLPRVINQETFYSFGFLSQGPLTDLYQNKTDQTLAETKKQANSLVLNKMLTLSNRHPNNELLLICITQIYLKKLNDTSKALYTLSLLRNRHLSLSAKISITTISSWLERVHSKSHQKTDKDYNYFDYFAYRSNAVLLKKHIAAGIQQQILLWKELRQDSVEVIKVIAFVQAISIQAKITRALWQNNFKGKEGVYLNATIMYSTYVQVVQSLPRLSFSLLKKAFDPFSKKPILQENMAKILNGKSAVILASIESTKLGKVIDASSSVEKLFEMKRDILVGSNAGLIMPRYIAKKHNDTIQRYQKSDDQDYKKKITTYAKTLHDNYFQVELKLSLYPLIDRGLNMMVHLEKISEFETLIVLDHQANIIELSQNLRVLLNIHEKNLGSLNISKVCPNFMQKIISNKSHTINHRSDSNNLETPRLPSRTKRKSTFIVSNPTAALSPRYPQDTGRAFLSTERTSLNQKEEEEEDLLPICRLGTNKKGVDVVYTKTVAEGGNPNDHKKFLFCPIGEKPENSSISLIINNVEEVVYEGDHYSIIKIKDFSSNSMGKLDFAIKKSVKSTKNHPIDDQFAEYFPTEEEKPEHEEQLQVMKSPTSTTTRPFLLSEEQKLEEADEFDESIDTKIEESFTRENKIAALNFNLFRNTRKLSAGAASVAASQSTQRDPTDAVKNFKRLEQPRPAMKIAMNFIFFSILVIISSMVASLLYNKSSLDEMATAMSIVNIVNIRVSKAIMAWQSVVFIYLRAVNLRPSNSKVQVYVETCRNATLAMLQNSEDTSRLLSSIPDKAFLRTLYTKSISFWEPLEGSLFNNGTIESFTASQILVDYNLAIGRFNGSFPELNNRRKPLFSMNNTVNDYYLTMENAINEISDFLTRTNNANIRLLKAIVALENVFAVMPLLLIINQYLKNAKLFGKLFNAMTQLKLYSLSKRAAELENIRVYFEKNIEDEVHLFKEVRYHETAKTENTKQVTQKTFTRTFKMGKLYIYMLKYIAFALTLTAIIITLLLVWQNSSVQNFHKLESMNQKVIQIYSIYTKVNMVHPTLCYFAMFKNSTNFKLLNQDIYSQLQLYNNHLINANDLLLSTVQIDDEGIKDPVVLDILQGDVCKYVDQIYTQNCLQITGSNSFGLLGLNPKLRQALDPMIVTFTPSLTYATALSSMSASSAQLGFIHLVTYSAYSYLCQYFVDNFHTSTDKYIDFTFTFFWINLVVVIISMLLIRAIVLTRLKELDVTMRGVFKITPWKLFEENKIITNYLLRDFREELNAIKTFE